MSRFKRIEEYDPAELDFAIQHAVDHCEAKGLDFWTIFKGIDAYNERRKRKQLLDAQQKGTAPHAKGDPLGR